MGINTEETYSKIPEIQMGFCGRTMPVLGMGTAAYPVVTPEEAKEAVIEAIKLGYRHFGTSPMYGTEQAPGQAIREALSLGLIETRDELFVTSKLWCSDAHHEHVVPAIQRTLANLKLEYLDLYLIHWPVSSKAGVYEFPIKPEDFLPLDLKSVWASMEECQRFGLTKSIGVSNFSCKKLADVLSVATIPPAVNQVEMNPLWQQKKLRDLCKANGVLVSAYSPLGAKGTLWGSDRVMGCEVLEEIADAKGKTIAQVCLRWAYKQGVSVLVKSFNKERMEENLKIFNWALSDDEIKIISQIQQRRCSPGEEYVSRNGPIKTIEELWDGEV